jgi:hypothetical protein
MWNVFTTKMIIPLQTVPVFLTEDEAQMFLKFQKHFHFFQVLEEHKAFDIRSGSITLKFDNNGQIKIVEKKEFFEV